MKFPVFSSHAIQDVDLKLGPEMKSTGEGMYVGFNPESALKKIFAGIWQTKGCIYMEGAGELRSRRTGGLHRTVGRFSGLDQTEGQSAAHPFSRVKRGEKAEDRSRHHGVAVMTEEETVRAF